MPKLLRTEFYPALTHLLNFREPISFPNSDIDVFTMSNKLAEWLCERGKGVSAQNQDWAMYCGSGGEIINTASVTLVTVGQAKNNTTDVMKPLCWVVHIQSSSIMIKSLVCEFPFSQVGVGAHG